MSPPMTAGNDDSASTCRYISSPTSGSGAVSFTFAVPTSGDYHLWARSMGISWGENSFFVSVDGGQEFHYEIPQPGGQWVWSWNLVHPNQEPALPITLQAGGHLIRFRSREPNSRLDTVTLTNNGNYVPAEVAPCNPTPTRTTTSQTVPTPTTTRTFTATSVQTISVTPTTTATPTVTPSAAPTATPTFLNGQPHIYQQGQGGYNGCQDTYISAWYPDTSYSTRDSMHIRADNQMAGLIRYELASIPTEAIVTSAILSVYATQQEVNSPLSVGVYEVYRHWVATEATWTRAYYNTSWSSLGCNDTNSDRAAIPESNATVLVLGQWYDFGITNMVQKWVRDPSVNHGLTLKAFGATADIHFASSEHGDISRHPKLTINYRMPTPTPSCTPRETPSPSTTATATETATITPTSTRKPERSIWLPMILRPAEAW